MAKKAMNFKSAEAMHKWMAFGHMHKKFENSPGNTPVSIGGKPHKVQHGSTTGHRGSMGKKGK